MVDQPGIGRCLIPGLPLDFAAVPHLSLHPAPRLGEHTDTVFAEILGLSPTEISRLQAAGIVGGPDGR